MPLNGPVGSSAGWCGSPPSPAWRLATQPGPDQSCGLDCGSPPLSSIPVEYLTPAIEDRAVDVLTLLADRGQHRAPSIPDLIIAATAELAGLTVLHLPRP